MYVVNVVKSCRMKEIKGSVALLTICQLYVGKRCAKVEGRIARSEAEDDGGKITPC